VWREQGILWVLVMKERTDGGMGQIEACGLEEFWSFSGGTGKLLDVDFVWGRKLGLFIAIFQSLHRR
jgi:hypothetical protein